MARRILLVEDDELLLESLTDLLEEEGYQVTGALSAEAALEEAGGRSFDLVVTDVRMPGMSGMTMLRHLRRSAPDTRAVVITGFADFEAPVEAFRLQVDDFITKPFDDQTFLKAVRRALEWLDRQAWWSARLAESTRQGLQLLEWSLLSGQGDHGTRAGRQRQLALRLGTLCGLEGDELESLGWAALLGAVTGPEALRSCPAGDASGGSPAGLIGTAARWALESEGLPGAVLAAVSRFDALSHPADAPLGLSRQECLTALRRDWEGPPEVLERLAQALEQPPSEEAEERPTAALGMALGYLKAGRADLARAALQGQNGSAEARLALATAELACGDAERAAELAAEVAQRTTRPLQRADALAIEGAARQGEQTRQAVEIFRSHGAARGEVRSLLLRAWGASLSGRPAPLEQAVTELLERVDTGNLDWVLWRERWLALAVLSAAAETRCSQQVRPWLERLGKGLAGAGPSPETLVVEGLGPLRIRYQGRDIEEKEWKTSKSQGLFLVLLLHAGNEVPDERLTDLFWADLEGDRAQANLYSAMTYVRRALKGPDNRGPNPVIHRRGRCRFNPDLPHSVDFLDFEERVTRGLHGRNAELLSSALELYGGDLLENQEHDWIVPYRRRYRELAVRALEMLLELFSEDASRCRSLAEQLLTIDRCHQGAYQTLMRLCAEAGQPERAARLYWDCQQALEEEFHLAPSAETTQLFKDLSLPKRPNA